MMSTFDEDMERGYLETGEPLEAKYGIGWWTAPEPEPELDAVDVIEQLLQKVAELQSENARLKERLRWVPVSERLPEHENQVWICRKDAHGDIVFENNKWDMRQEKWKYYTINVLGWQEIEPFNLKGDE